MDVSPDDSYPNLPPVSPIPQGTASNPGSLSYAGPKPNGWTIQKVVALCTLVGMLAAAASALVLGWNQIEVNKERMDKFEVVVGDLQHDVALLCIKMHPQDPKQCRLYGRKIGP